MRATFLIAVLGLGLLILPISLAAETTNPPEVSTRLKPDEVASILRDAGYRAEVIHQNNRWRIRTGMGGRKITVYLYCDDSGTCDSLTYSLDFSASPDFTLTIANKWNRDKRYAKAYIDTDGGIVVEYDLAFAGGVTHETVAESARLFDRLVSMFDNMISSSSSQ